MILVPLALALIGIVAAFALIARSHAGRKLAEAPAELRLRLGGDPPTLDPARAADEASVAVVAQIFDGLVEIDPGTGSPRPSLASSWDVSADGRTYTFHLRPGARFHNGRLLDASDVVYSFERVLSPAVKSERRWVLSRIRGADDYWEGRTIRVAGLRAVGASAVEIELLEPYGPFVSMLALEAAGVVPPEVYADPEEAYLRAPVGAGPFRFVSWEPGVAIRLAANPDHHGGRPAIAGILFRILPSETTAFEEYLAGGLDVLGEIPGGRRAELAAARPDEFRHGAQPATAFIGFNHARGPLAGSRALRRALNHAVDKESLCRVIQEGKDLPARGILPPGVAGFDPEGRGYPYDPGRARALLAEAGHPDGRGLPELTLGYNTSESHRRACQRIQADLAAVGVKVALREYDAGALMRALVGDPERGSDLDMFRMAWLADYPDADAFLTPTLESTSTPLAGNFGRYANPRFDALLAEARAASDPGRRLALFRQAERLAVDDAAWLFLYHYGDDTLVKPYVKGLVIPAFGEFLAPYERVSLDTAALHAGM
jgi:peptide/nickel transport system substrate-binding protein/oligopeptide transport system substrate-binding protein